MNDVLQRVRTLVGSQFEELAGTHVVGELPLTDALVNRVIAERLAQASGPVAGARVHARDDDALEVTLTLRGVPMVSTVPISARIDQQPHLPDSPVLGLQWSLAGLGALARIAGNFAARIRTLPPGVRLEGDRLLLDLRELLRAQGLSDLLRYAARMEVHAREGRIIVLFELRA